MANVCFLKNCSIPLATRKMQIKSTIVRIVSSKKSKQTTKTRNEMSAVKGLGKKTALSKVGVSVNWYEYGLRQRHLCIWVHAAFIHSSQEMEPA